MRRLISRLLISAWPHYVGIDQLMAALHPIAPSTPLFKRKVRGYPLQIEFCPRTYMGKYLYFRGMYEEGMFRKLNTLLKPGMSFIDVGANVGLYTLVAPHLVGPKGRVIAFEPQSLVRKTLRSNLVLNDLRNVTVRSEALGSAAGIGKMFQVSRINDGQATTRVLNQEKTFSTPEEIRIVSLDDILPEFELQEIDGMKIDVEGGEYDTLLGMESLLRNSPPRFIFFECIDTHLRRFGVGSSELFDYLRRHGYDLYCLWRAKWRKVASQSDHQSYSHSPDFVALLRENKSV